MNQQNGGAPFPLSYYDEYGYQPYDYGYGQVGGATSLPIAWYNPNAGVAGSQFGCNFSGDPRDFIGSLYRSDRAMNQALYCTNTMVIDPTAKINSCGSNKRMVNNKMNQQTGGNAFGAPFFIPNYGRNPNQTSGQMNTESQMLNGFSYRFETPPSCTSFCSQWGNNAPSFNPIR